VGASLLTCRQTSKHGLKTHRPGRKFRSVPSANKMMLMLFWDLVGPSLSSVRIRAGQSVVHSIVVSSKRSWNLLLVVNIEEY